MSEIDIDRMKEVAKAATPGPWVVGPDRVWGDETADGWTTILLTPAPNSPAGSARRRDFDLDAAHIATFDPPTVLALIERMEKVEAEKAAIREELFEAEAEIERRDHHECTPLEARTITAEENEAITASFLAEAEKQLGEVRADLAEAVEALCALLAHPSNNPRISIVTEHPLTGERGAWTRLELAEGRAARVVAKHKAGAQ